MNAAGDHGSVEPPPRRYRCNAAAKWLPRTLGGAVLASAVIAARGLDPSGALPGSTTVRTLVLLSGAALALWIVRSGAVMQFEAEPRTDRLWLGTARGGRVLEYQDITTIDFHGPFAGGRKWVPALVLVDRFGAAWSIPSMVQGGDQLLADLLDRCGRTDLEAWAEVRGIRRRMAHGGRFVGIGYLAAAILLAAAVAFHLG